MALGSHRRHKAYRLPVLVSVLGLLVSIKAIWLGHCRHRAGWAFAGQLLVSRQRSHTSPSELVSISRAGWRSEQLRQHPVRANAKGFGSEPAVPCGADVPEPAGGWPTISILILGSNSKVATPESLKILAEQDYPFVRIKEVVVSNAAKLATSAPEALKKLLRDFVHPEIDTVNLRDEIVSCTGHMVAIWGDDQVSAPHRLRAQVARALSKKAVTVLQPTWFFDPLSQSFQEVQAWPTDQLEIEDGGDDTAAAQQNKLIKIFACSDLLTICGEKKLLAEAADSVQAAGTPQEEVKEVVQNIAMIDIIEDFRWAAVRTPPVIARYAPGVPDKALVQLAKGAFPKASSSKGQQLMDSVVKEIDTLKLSPADAINRLLSADNQQVLADTALQKIRRSVTDSLKRAGPESVAAAVSTLRSWSGLAVGQGDVKAARIFPAFYEAFAAVRGYCAENADYFDMVQLGSIAEGLVLLATKMWATDDKVNDAMVMTLTKELYQQGFDKPVGEKFTVASMAEMLGLKKVLQAMAYAALDIPNSLLQVNSLSSFAWALGEANVENSSLQIKVAKAIVANIDKVQPPDIGKIFVAMHERNWWKDDDSIAYLTQSLLSRVKQLKEQDPGIAKMIADAQAQAA